MTTVIAVSGGTLSENAPVESVVVNVDDSSAIASFAFETGVVPSSSVTVPDSEYETGPLSTATSGPASIGGVVPPLQAHVRRSASSSLDIADIIAARRNAHAPDRNRACPVP